MALVFVSPSRTTLSNIDLIRSVVSGEVIGMRRLKVESELSGSMDNSRPYLVDAQLY